MDYSRVFLCILLFLWQLCLPTNGACRCRDQAQCDPSYTHCVAGCETGFAGNRCQYVNKLAFASCTKGQLAVDGNLGTCTSASLLRITCSVEEPARTFNIIRIFHRGGKQVSKFYVSEQRGWKEVSIYRNVTDKITDYKYSGAQRFSRLLFEPKRSVCEVAVTNECPNDDACNLECNCKIASDCLESPVRCPSGCAEGYIGENIGCKQKDTTDRGQISTSRAKLLTSATSKTSPTPTEDTSDSGRKSTSTATLVSSAASNKPTPTEDTTDRGQISTSRAKLLTSATSKTSPTPTDSSDSGRKSTSTATMVSSATSNTPTPTECPNGSYGANCASTCSPGCVSSSCDRKDGKCVQSGGAYCKPGWKRGSYSRCDECDRDKYGVDCSQNCSSGCASRGCDSSSGVCPSGRCKPGWRNANPQLQRCDEICSPWTYGENCLQDCSVGCVNQTCDRTTGRCDVCLDGWEHEDLNTTRCDKAGHPNVNLVVGLLLFLIVVIAVVMCVVFFREPLRRFKDKKTGERRNDGINLPMAARGDQDASEQLAVNDEDEVSYVNVPSSVPVAVSAFKEFVARKKATKEILVKEYAELPKGLTAIHDKAVTKVNSPKNRFKGIYPYNHSLVVLKRKGGSTGYINASYIDGRTRGKQYIATQGPLPHTVVDFWEMIWQEQVPVIVMLANIVEDGRRRCEPYWPNEQGEDTKTFGPWKITVADSCPLADFTIRTLTIKKGHMQRTVKHVHYMVWPDKDVPDNTMSLVELRNKLRTYSDFAQGPMVVHCSAGVGRTGTLIALDSLVEDAETRNMVDIYGCVWRLRTCRVSMVQTQSQYVFLHDCLLDALCHTVHPTRASLYDNAYKQLKNNERSPNLAVAYQKLCECPETDHVSDAARDLENIGKNRNKNILPGDKHRAILLTREAEGTDYINAVIAPSYEKRGAFILTQIPLTSTVVDFWRLVRDYDVRGIVLLENYTDMDANCGVFWAKDKTPTKFGPFSVSEGRTEEHTGFTMEKICYSLGNDGREVTVFRSPAWPKKSSLPDSPSSLLGLIDFLRQWNAGAPSPLLVVCRDGATRSGLFCVLASAVQRLLLEKDVALQQTIRSIRFVRKQVIPNLEQFEFCYDSVKAYMDSFQEYSNFA